MASIWAAYGSVVEFAMVYSILALGQYISSWSGILNFANPVFAAVAGFLSAYLLNNFGIPFWAVLLLGGLLGALTAFVLSYPLLKLESHWMALASLSFLLISRVIVLNLPTLTGGVKGVSLVRTVRPVALFITLAIIAYAISRIHRSRLGLAFEFVRHDSQAASTFGINPVRIQRTALTISGLIVGLGGVLYANLVQFISPDTFYTNMAFILVSSVILGGVNHWSGAIIGAIVYTALPEILRPFLGSWVLVVNGIALVCIIIFLPGGIVNSFIKKYHQRKIRASKSYSL
jgi:branched-chain amino acid transport system permease protein